ncbi:AAA family ATPase [Pseudoalteromonas sp. JBTF-M23]|uniref:AAA family ATPase n=1 Tax=Pseudoalteromonas caenipelagi TaxID=2726988 RepID=A0A849VCX9_9GAMM|nr:AAA family ATPase [Pseudoalteromonas caenipelagi]NOU50915.1 AAA family ATPase [Pseudoalteromonas caenipelagi]
MKLNKVCLKNFRRLEKVEIDFEAKETLFVGPNNSGKTSATAAFKLFLRTRSFKIHDYSSSQISVINRFGHGEDVSLPSIQMDMWFTIDPDTEYGRAITLIPQLTTLVSEVGIRIQLSALDIDKLRDEYQATFPVDDCGRRKKGLSEFLAISNNMSRHFKLNYFVLENVAGDYKLHHLDGEEAKKTLASIMRVDFVEAQRNIDDQELARSNKLSKAFGAYYKNNLQHPDVNEEAMKVIDENNNNLNKHYKSSFSGLMDTLGSLGVPSVNDRSLRLISSLSPEVALQGNTELLYVDGESQHELPEAYNGLGFKNLVYIAIQISHFYLQWITTESSRPLCQLIFIEEPEVHLHSQVQQAFIANVWAIISDVAEKQNENTKEPQLCITTHSSHILDKVEFEKVRYFKRCLSKVQEESTARILNASKVLSMRSFMPDGLSLSEKEVDKNEVLKFLKKYIRITHCDLFFADAAILIEGAAEKLLLPNMIKKSSPTLESNYITTLEVGGAYASRFAGLLEFLGIPYLVITDIDSVDPNNNRKACIANFEGAITSNSSLKYFLNTETVKGLNQLEQAKVIIADNSAYIAYQKSIFTPTYGKDIQMHGRTLEEAIIYENIEAFKSKSLVSEIVFTGDAKQDHETVFKTVKSSTFKKTEFAIDLIVSEHPWETPSYIANGLKWLEQRLNLGLLNEEKE